MKEVKVFYNKICKKFTLTKEFKEFSDLLNQSFALHIKEQNMVFYYFDEEKDKIYIENEIDYKEFLKEENLNYSTKIFLENNDKTEDAFLDRSLLNAKSINLKEPNESEMCLTQKIINIVSEEFNLTFEKYQKKLMFNIENKLNIILNKEIPQKNKIKSLDKIFDENKSPFNLILEEESNIINENLFFKPKFDNLNNLLCFNTTSDKILLEYNPEKEVFSYDLKLFNTGHEEIPKFSYLENLIEDSDIFGERYVFNDKLSLFEAKKVKLKFQNLNNKNSFGFLISKWRLVKNLQRTVSFNKEQKDYYIYFIFYNKKMFKNDSTVDLGYDKLLNRKVSFSNQNQNFKSVFNLRDFSSLYDNIIRKNSNFSN